MQLSGKGTSGKFETDYLNDCFWPKAEAQVEFFSVSFGENRSSNLISQRRFTIPNGL